MRTPILELQHINFGFPGTRKILHDVNYRVFAEDFVILLGSNGSGKSSLLKVIDRRYPIVNGTIKLHGEDMMNFLSADFYRQVITLTQNCTHSLFLSLTVLENYVLVRQRYENKLLHLGITGEERDFLAQYLKEFNANLSLKLNAIVGTLSGGEQQTLALALSVLTPPKILLLDEHTSALDPQAAERLMVITERVVRTQHITCILATHDLDLALRYGDRILALSAGRVLQGIESSEKRTLQRQELVKRCYASS